MNLFNFFNLYTISADLYRANAGSYDDYGKWTAATPSAETTKILIPQPADGEFLRLLADGEDAGDFVMTCLPSVAGINTGQEGRSPDELVIDSVRYEVFAVSRWGRYGGFDKIILKRKK